MADFSKNPKKPFEVPVPNKIRKRIAMHYEIPRRILKPTLPFLLAPLPKKWGSMWSRFTNGVKKIFIRGRGFGG